MCGPVMRGTDALPWSENTSRTKGSRRNLGDLVWPAVAAAIPGRGRKARSRRCRGTGEELDEPRSTCEAPEQGRDERRRRAWREGGSVGGMADYRAMLRAQDRNQHPVPAACQRTGELFNGLRAIQGKKTSPPADSGAAPASSCRHRSEPPLARTMGAPCQPRFPSTPTLSIVKYHGFRKTSRTKREGLRPPWRRLVRLLREAGSSKRPTHSKQGIFYAEDGICREFMRPSRDVRPTPAPITIIVLYAGRRTPRLR